MEIAREEVGYFLDEEMEDNDQVDWEPLKEKTEEIFDALEAGDDLRNEALSTGRAWEDATTAIYTLSALNIYLEALRGAADALAAFIERNKEGRNIA